MTTPASVPQPRAIRAFCDTVQRPYTTHTYAVQEHGVHRFAWSNCPFCDRYRRTYTDAEYDAAHPQPHFQKLEETTHMVQVQIIIEMPTDADGHITCNILRREDATPDELACAKAVEELHAVVFQQMLDQGIDAKLVKIEEPT